MSFLPRVRETMGAFRSFLLESLVSIWIKFLSLSTAEAPRTAWNIKNIYFYFRLGIIKKHLCFEVVQEIWSSSTVLQFIFKTAPCATADNFSRGVRGIFNYSRGKGGPKHIFVNFMMKIKQIGVLLQASQASHFLSSLKHMFRYVIIKAAMVKISELSLLPIIRNPTNYIK